MLQHTLSANGRFCCKSRLREDRSRLGPLSCGCGLLSYGVNTSDVFRRAGEYASRILRGAKPADLPVQAPTKFELVVNLRPAKALGIAIPKMLLAGADQVIE